MLGHTPLPENRFRVDWAKLNNALFALICADPHLRARYDAADSAESEHICSEQIDVLVKDVDDFVDRFLVLE
jgi:hypothetical protein